MALAHWVFQYPKYAEQMRKGPEGRSSYILMDSGSFEGQQVNLERFNKAADALKADEVVLPDAPGDPKETLRRSWDTLSKIATKRVMFVPQGRTYEEWCKCLEVWLNQWSKHSWDDAYKLSLGVASLREPNSTKTVVGTKAALLEKILDLGYPVHLLGLPHLGNHVKDILPRAHTAGVRGIDTSTAFALGVRGILVTPAAKKVRLGNPTQYTKLNTHTRRLIVLNIRILNAWTLCGKGSEAIPTHLIRNTASAWLKYYAEGFTELDIVMEACGMPAGKYALLKEHRREKSIRPLPRFQKLEENEVLVEVKK
jgi:hypothetical protein